MSSKYKECVAYRVSDKELKKMYDSDFALRLFDFNAFKKTAKETSVKLALKARCNKKSKKTKKTKKTNNTKRFKRRK